MQLLFNSEPEHNSILMDCFSKIIKLLNNDESYKLENVNIEDNLSVLTDLIQQNLKIITCTYMCVYIICNI